ncbi:uncharacterized protein LOC127786767 isoform X2 [Diospyros lotus]|uniref:uncharacterized protein LOC127786767 isoform X2 n=1 Tax=Diospyros lotus TaxID=55363 RepID=UPI002258D2C7|nr:uncharacterized protein LOC127786767 isoform X2 [Diospyros lotus]
MGLHCKILDAVLELEPMSPYNRLLLHLLADIFGLSHHSVGEGDERHLLLERSPETSILPILVSDLLWQYDKLHPPTTSHQLLRRSEASPAKVEKSANQFSLKHMLLGNELAHPIKQSALRMLKKMDSKVRGQAFKGRNKRIPT